MSDEQRLDHNVMKNVAEWTKLDVNARYEETKGIVHQLNGI